MAKANTVKNVFYGTGRRKKSIARVRLVEGTVPDEEIKRMIAESYDLVI